MKKIKISDFKGLAFDLDDTLIDRETAFNKIFKIFYKNQQAINKKYVHLEKKELLQQIKKLEKKMLHYATDLEFEAAANIRDEIDIIKKLLLKYKIDQLELMSVQKKIHKEIVQLIY